MLAIAGPRQKMACLMNFCLPLTVSMWCLHGMQQDLGRSSGLRHRRMDQAILKCSMPKYCNTWLALKSHVWELDGYIDLNGQTSLSLVLSSASSIDAPLILVPLSASEPLLLPAASLDPRRILPWHHMFVYYVLVLSPWVVTFSYLDHCWSACIKQCACLATEISCPRSVSRIWNPWWRLLQLWFRIDLSEA